MENRQYFPTLIPYHVLNDAIPGGDVNTCIPTDLSIDTNKGQLGVPIAFSCG